MPYKFQQMSSVFGIIAFEPAAIISAIFDVLPNSPKILDLTKGDGFQVTLSYINGKL